MKTIEQLIAQKLEEAIVMARAEGLGHNYFNIMLEDGENVEVNVSWRSSSYDC